MDAAAVSLSASPARSWRWVRAGLWMLAAVLAAWSWRRWPDVQVDFGRELYVPWRLTEGDHLHRDLAWFNGPLSAWWNALWFRLAGTSLGTLVWVNLALLLLTLELLTGAVRRWAGNVAGAASGVLFLCVFAFGRHAPIGNYNFVTPYSHELTHGLVLSLGALALLARGGERGSRLASLGAGLCLGLVFLTKAEVFLAAAAACGLRLWACPGSVHRGAFLLGGIAPVAAAFGWLLMTLGWEGAPQALAGSWAHVGNDQLRGLAFYRSILGSDDPLGNLTTMGYWVLGGFAVCGSVLAASWRLEESRLRSFSARGLGFVVGAVLAGMVLADRRWLGVARPLPPLLLGALLLLAPRLRVLRGELRTRTADQLAFTLFALVLLGKMILSPSFLHYGFVLALPASAVLIALALGESPAWLRRRGRAGSLLESVGLGAVILVAALYAYDAHRWYHGEPNRWPDYPQQDVGSGADLIRARWRGEEMAALLDDLDARLDPGETLLVLPEGVMLNYLLRRESPTPFVNFMPPELVLWGEDAVIAALEQAPPDVVAIVHKDTSEYGYPWFGKDYGEQIWSWVRERYEVQAMFGAIPLTSSRFGASVLEPK